MENFPSSDSSVKSQSFAHKLEALGAKSHVISGKRAISLHHFKNNICTGPPPTQFLVLLFMFVCGVSGSSGFWVNLVFPLFIFSSNALWFVVSLIFFCTQNVMKPLSKAKASWCHEVQKQDCERIASRRREQEPCDQ